MNKFNKESVRSGFINTSDQRPEWQQKRGIRYGNRRKEIAKLKVKNRRIERKNHNECLRKDQF